MSSPAPGTAARILLVEDDDDVRGLVAQLLGDAGYQVVPTRDAQQGLWLARSEQPDLVVSDITMPELDGFALLRALQQNPETAGLPVLFLTARREFSDRVRAFRHGVVDYITKPFTREGLLQRVERALQQRRRSEPGREAREGPGAAQALLDEARAEARSGVLRATDGSGETRLLMHAGEVLQATGHLPQAGNAEFVELDPAREHVVTAGAERPGGALPAPAGGALPEFDDVPPALRSALVAEDDPAFRRFLVHALASRGFTVYEAADGEQALQRALERRPWLILTDVSMPKLDGLELCRRVRQHSLIRHTPLVFISGWDDYKDRYRGLAAGADEYLSKTTPIRELLIRVQLILRRYVELGRPLDGRALAGELAVVGSPGLLQMVHLGRLSGSLHVHGPQGSADLAFSRGEPVSARAPGVEGVEAVYALLGWNEGSFEFTAGNPQGAPLGESFDQLLLEGCRRLDEARR